MVISVWGWGEEGSRERVEEGGVEEEGEVFFFVDGTGILGGKMCDKGAGRWGGWGCREGGCGGR